MEKSFKIFLIFVLMSLVFFLIGVMKFFIKNDTFIYEQNYDEIIKEEIYNIDEIESLVFNLRSSDIELIKTENDELKIIQYGSKKSKKFIENRSNRTLEINDRNNLNFVFFSINSSSKYIIYIPNDFDKNLEVSTISGDIKLPDLKLEDINIKTTSGNLNIDEIELLNNGEFSTVSGDIDISSVIGNEIFVKTTSGDIDIELIKSSEVELKTTSGSINVYELDGKLYAKAISGDIEIKSLLIQDNSEIRTVSGDVYLGMEKNNNCVIITESTTGNENVKNSTYGLKQYDLKIETTTGDIKVN